MPVDLTHRRSVIFESVISANSALGSALAAEYPNPRTRIDDVPISDVGDRAVAELFVQVDQGEPEAELERWCPITAGQVSSGTSPKNSSHSGKRAPMWSEPAKPDLLRLFTASLAD